jgi:peptidoglycan/LPS O-acetylase OafA/YrhL
LDSSRRTIGQVSHAAARRFRGDRYPPPVLSGRTATRAAPASGLGTRRRDIQGLRALAVVLILAFHAGLPVPGGFVGVDVFFVISGFVITAMALRELDGTGAIDLVGFYLGRRHRIT